MRLEVAQRMGQLAEPVFTGVLIQMSAEPTMLGCAALESLTKLTGQDFSHDSEVALLVRDAQTNLWQAWYRRQQLAEAAPDSSIEPAGSAVPATYVGPQSPMARLGCFVEQRRA